MAVAVAVAVDVAVAVSVAVSVAGLKYGPPRRKNGLFRVNFGDLLLNIFEKIFFSYFFSPMGI